MIHEGNEYEGASVSYGQSKVRKAVSVDALVQLPEQAIEIKNGSTIEFVSEDDSITKQPDVLKVIVTTTDRNFNNFCFSEGITLSQLNYRGDPIEQ